MGIQPSDIVQTPASGDQANAVVEGTFTGTGQSDSFLPWGPFNIVFGGRGGQNESYSATIRLLRSFDGGVTWWVCGLGGDGTQAEWATGKDVSIVAGEPEKGVAYALECTVYASGTIDYRMSATGAAALSLAVASSI